MADANSNGRILNKDIYERITRVETKLDMFIENVKDICDAHSEKFKAVDEDNICIKGCFFRLVISFSYNNRNYNNNIIYSGLICQ